MLHYLCFYDIFLFQVQHMLVNNVCFGLDPSHQNDLWLLWRCSETFGKCFAKWLVLKHAWRRKRTFSQSNFFTQVQSLLVRCTSVGNPLPKSVSTQILENLVFRLPFASGLRKMIVPRETPMSFNNEEFHRCRDKLRILTKTGAKEIEVEEG